MQLLNSGQQRRHDYGYRADGLTLSGSLPQLVLAESLSRSTFFFQNLSDTDMYLEFGSARAHAVLTAGVVTSVVVDNQGFNFSLTPVIECMGGGGQVPAVGVAQPGYPSPQAAYTAAGRPASLRANLVGGKVTSISIDDPGSGYLAAPFVFIRNQMNDPAGCADPSVNSGSGILLHPSASYSESPTICTTDSVAVFCSAPNKAFTCRWTP